MIFQVRKVDIETDGHSEVYMRLEDAQKMNIHVGDRVEVTWRGGSVVATINMCRWMVSYGELGVSREIWESGIGEQVTLKPLPKPKSVGYIRKRLFGVPLKKGEIKQIVFDLMKNRLSSVEAAYFVASAYVQRLSFEEEESLTREIVAAGDTIKFSKKKSPILDKHCIGGVPGNRTTPIVVPIVAAAGYTFPKTSSRAITSPAGTADVLEVLCNIVYSAKDMKAIVDKAGAAMVWGGSVNLAPVDDVLLKLRYPLRLDPTSFLLASIIAKKKSVGSEKVLIDIPLGAKVKDPQAARDLADRFRYLGKRVGLEITSLITDGFQPIGYGVGPSLEARDVVDVLRGKGPEDLKEKSLQLSAKLFELAGEKNGYSLAKKILRTKKAHAKFKEIIEVQGGNPDVKSKDIPVGEFTTEVRISKGTSYVYYDSEVIAHLARLAGAPAIKGSGVELLIPSGSKANKGQKVIRIRTPVEARLESVRDYLKEHKPLVSRNVVIESL